jgi:hypothetical protein
MRSLAVGLVRRLSCHSHKAVTEGEMAQPFDGLAKCRSTICDGGHGAHFLRDHLVDPVVAVMEPRVSSGSTARTRELAREARASRGTRPPRRRAFPCEPFPALVSGVRYALGRGQFC